MLKQFRSKSASIAMCGDYFPLNTHPKVIPKGERAVARVDTDGVVDIRTSSITTERDINRIVVIHFSTILSLFEPFDRNHCRRWTKEKFVLYHRYRYSHHGKTITNT